MQDVALGTLNKTVIFWKEAAECKVIASILITISIVVDHQDSIMYWIALSCVAVVPLRQQSGDAHHLRRLFGFLDLVFPG